MNRVGAAIRYIREDFTHPLQSKILARVAGVAESTLNRHFRDVTAMSPLRYQKKLRLHEARHLMLSEHVDAANAAFRVGYESPTQFNREHRRQFEAPPKRDVIHILNNSEPR
jgi:AraC-like DNA-binding protein